MKQTLLIIAFLVSALAQTFAAPPRWQPRRLEHLKIAYITRELNLTQEEAQKFWPVYNRYVADMKQMRQNRKEDVLAQEEELLTLRKKYRDEFRKVLVSDQRANKALTADRDFNNVIRKELQKRIEMRKGKIQ